MDAIITSGSSGIGPYSIATPTAQEAVLVANTPSFLLDRLRRDIAVQYVLDNMKPPEIVDALREGLASPSSEPFALVPLYIYLAALSTTDPRDQKLWNDIRSLDLSHLEWGDTIRNLILADAIPTTMVELTLPSPSKP